MVAIAAILTVFRAEAAAAAVRPAPGTWFSFAPYVDFAGYPVPNLDAVRHGSGARDLTLGFVTAPGDSQCTPTWGGYTSYPAFGAHAYQVHQIARFRRSGGNVVPSFGGEDGSELAQVCSSVDALRDAYAKVISAYGVTHLDFDIEGADVADFAAARRRAAALAALQHSAARAGRTLRVALTLPVLPSGLTSDSEQILRDTIRGGVSVSMVNGMAMDYGDSAAPHPAGRMGQYAIDVAAHLRAQLASVFPGLNRRGIESLIGITPMIGINDTADEIFTLAEARQLASYASRHRIGMLSMWQAERDGQCARPVSYAEISCSGVTQKAWAFSGILRR